MVLLSITRYVPESPQAPLGVTLEAVPLFIPLTTTTTYCCGDLNDLWHHVSAHHCIQWPLTHLRLSITHQAGHYGPPEQCLGGPK